MKVKHFILTTDIVDEPSGFRCIQTASYLTHPGEFVYRLWRLFAFNSDLTQALKLKIFFYQSIGTVRNKNAPGFRQAFHSRGQIRRIPHCRVIHTKVIADSTHNNRSGVQTDSHLKIQPELRLNLPTVLGQRFLNGKGGMTCPLGMVLMGQGSAEECHHTVPGELINGPFIFMDFLHQNLKAPIHDLMNRFGIQFFRKGSKPGDIGKEYGDQFSFTLKAAPGGQNLFRHKFWGIGVRPVIIDYRLRLRDLIPAKFLSTFTAEFFTHRYPVVATGAYKGDLGAAFFTELDALTIIGLACKTYHSSTLRILGVANNFKPIFCSRLSLNRGCQI
ncbi:MAG: hypothetical protein QNK41_02690 [Desulfosarcina sp.]|nr:hypothetical protein [Desulfosarcina sp.]